MKNKFIALLLIVAMMLPFGVLAEGEITNEYSTEQISQVDENKDQTTETTPSQTTPKETTPTDTTTPSAGSAQDLINQVENSDVTIEDVGDRLLNKLYQVANLLRKFAVPISVIFFIAGAFWAVWGAFGGKKDGPKGGIVVCLLSILMYTVCMYAEPIIVAMSKWLAS